MIKTIFLTITATIAVVILVATLFLNTILEFSGWPQHRLIHCRI